MWGNTSKEARGIRSEAYVLKQWRMEIANANFYYQFSQWRMMLEAYLTAVPKHL